MNQMTARHYCDFELMYPVLADGTGVKGTIYVHKHTRGGIHMFEYVVYIGGVRLLSVCSLQEHYKHYIFQELIGPAIQGIKEFERLQNNKCRIDNFQAYFTVLR